MSVPSISKCRINPAIIQGDVVPPALETIRDHSRMSLGTSTHEILLEERPSLYQRIKSCSQRKTQTKLSEARVQVICVRPKKEIGREYCQEPVKTVAPHHEIELKQSPTSSTIGISVVDIRQMKKDLCLFGVVSLFSLTAISLGFARVSGAPIPKGVIIAGVSISIFLIGYFLKTNRLWRQDNSDLKFKSRRIAPAPREDSRADLFSRRSSPKVSISYVVSKAQIRSVVPSCSADSDTEFSQFTLNQEGGIIGHSLSDKVPRVAFSNPVIVVRN